MKRRPLTVFEVLLLILILFAGNGHVCIAEVANEPEKSNTVSVSIAVKQKIRLVRYYYSGQAKSNFPPALDGSFSVFIMNNSPQSIILWQPETHGLIFVNVKTGKQYVIIHPCQCVKDVSKPEAIKLEPGAIYRFELSGWECQSIWEPPPPGEYMVNYRILPMTLFRHIVSQVVSSPEVEGVNITQFRELFTDDLFWEGGFSSKPVRIELRDPIKKLIK